MNESLILSSGILSCLIFFLLTQSYLILNTAGGYDNWNMQITPGSELVNGHFILPVSY